MNVLSLFDGISCAQLALKKARIDVDKYYASEVDKYAIAITQNRFPNTIQLGDVRKVDVKKLGKIDLLIGGSPCQNLSSGNTNKNGRTGLAGPKSCLFWEYVRILKETKPKYFVLENVNSMPIADRNTITEAIGVEPIMIDAALVSAQIRKRLFWTNIKVDKMPRDKGITIRDILEPWPEERFFVSEKHREAMNRIKKGKLKTRDLDGKTTTIIAKYFKQPIDGNYIAHEGRKNGEKTTIRMLTPLECERLQCIPDGYTEGVSNTQRYMCIGNAFNVDVVAHILKFIKKQEGYAISRRSNRRGRKRS